MTTINQHRRPAEAPAHPDPTKENATAGNRGAANKANQTDHYSIVEHLRETEREHGLFLPLAWAELGKSVKAPFRGKAKRKSRAAAINAKRYLGGAIAAELTGLIVLALVAGLLLLGGA